jgi:Uma2 family endonuclease
MNAMSPIYRAMRSPQVRRTSGPTRLRYSLDMFYRLGESGILDEWPKVELLNGTMFVSPQYIDHGLIQKRIYFGLDAVVSKQGTELQVLSEITIEIGTDSGPQPDIFIRQVGPASRGVPAEQVRLVVEVSDSTRSKDLNGKRKLYAKAGIPEYWVAVVSTRTVERFSEPDGKDYRRHDSIAFGDAVPSVTLPGITLPAGTIGN